MKRASQTGKQNMQSEKRNQYEGHIILRCDFYWCGLYSIVGFLTHSQTTLSLSNLKGNIKISPVLCLFSSESFLIKWINDAFQCQSCVVGAKKTKNRPLKKGWRKDVIFLWPLSLFIRFFLPVSTFCDFLAHKKMFFFGLFPVSLFVYRMSKKWF